MSHWYHAQLARTRPWTELPALKQMREDEDGVCCSSHRMPLLSVSSRFHVNDDWLVITPKSYSSGLLQAQAASQENLEQLRESSNASVRSQMELRIKDLESQLSRMKSQEDFDKIELEKYKQLYQEELRVRKSLSSKLNK